MCHDSVSACVCFVSILLFHTNTYISVVFVKAQTSYAERSVINQCMCTIGRCLVPGSISTQYVKARGKYFVHFRTD